MKIEHVAYMVADPVSMAKWYVEHLGMSVKRANPNPPTYGHFLADLSGMMLLEADSGPKEKVPNYNAIDPAVLHLALVSPDLKKDYSRLLALAPVRLKPHELCPMAIRWPCFATHGDWPSSWSSEQSLCWASQRVLPRLQYK